MKKLSAIACLMLSFLPVFAFQDPAINRIKEQIIKYYPESSGDIHFRVLSTTTGSANVVHYYGVQTLEGMDVFGSNFNIALKNGTVVVFNHRFVSDPLSKTRQEIELSAMNALEKVIPEQYVSFQTNLKQLSEQVYEYTDPLLSLEPIKIQKMWYLKGDELIKVWEVSYYFRNGQHWYNYRIDGRSGDILDKNDWVVNCGFGRHDHIEHDDHYSLPVPPLAAEATETHGTSVYRVFAIPTESPNHGNRSSVSDPADANASPYGWHDINGSAGAEYTITRGNNVLAWDDRADQDFGGSSPNGGSSLIFNDTFSKNNSPANYLNAAVTNLFYMNNIMHDVWYQYGFDEQSGNFQANNYGNGGNAGDYVFADAQDGSGTNNANFATPNDGSSPRMQMYLWNSSPPSDYFQVNSPSFSAGKYLANKAAFGPQLNKTPISGNLVLVATNTGTSEAGCGALTNASAISGNIALIERGGCTFVDKVRNAQAAGAKAVVIYDESNGSPGIMGGNGSSTADITIPAILIRRNDGLYIKGLLSTQTVNVSLYDSSVTTTTTYDSDFDNGVIAHEYGHGISNRLTGGRFASNCLRNYEQMGEGWSDFFSLVMTHEPDDEGSDSRGIGTYLVGEPVTGGGIRKYVYSTDMNISPYSYDELPTSAVPHGVGSIWTAMLWDMYWAFIDKYGYDPDIYNGTGGNNMAMQLVIDGLKLQPCEPGFVDGRDAILKADELLNDGLNQRLIWEVFAKRGLGYEADQGSSWSIYDGVASYEIPPDLAAGLAVKKTAVEEILNGSTMEYSFSATNYLNETLYNVVLRDSLPEGIDVDPADMSCNAQLIDNVIIITIDSIERSETFKCTMPAAVAFSSTSEILFEDDFENGLDNWTTTSISGSTQWSVKANTSVSGNNSIFIPDPDTKSDQTIQTELEITGFTPLLSFYHFYNSENTWDGGVVEIHNGVQWIDAEPYFVKNGYNATIQTNPASNISGRNAFTGNSETFIQSVIDLSEFTGKTVKIRFRFVSDAAAGGEGWYIDDVKISDAVVIENFLSAEFDGKTSRSGCLTFVTGSGIPGAYVPGLKTDELVEVYPNPADKTVHISLTQDRQARIQVIDANGKLVMQEEGRKDISLDISSLSGGMYQIIIQADDAVIRKKLIISR